MKEISFVIPCYNSEKTIEKVIKEVEEIMEKNKENSYEIILINDCSQDNTWEKIKQLTNKRENIKAINFIKNFGQHSALMAGYRNTNGKIVVSLDDDGQTPVNEVYSLINKINEGYDVVYASYKNKKHSYIRNIGTKLNNFMCEKLLQKPKDIMITSYFAMKKIIVDEIIKYDNPYTYVSGLVLRTTKNIGKAEVYHRNRKQGKSGYTFIKLLSLWMNGFTAFSINPLRISTILGLIISIIGFVYGIHIFILNFFIKSVIITEYKFIMAILLFISGIIMIMIGMLGEYIGRIYICMNNSPQYVIKEIIDSREEVEKN